MPKLNEQEYYPLHIQKPELIELFRKKTMTAILVLSITYLAGVILFIPLYLNDVETCYFVLLLPLLGYCWLVTFGAKHVNNHYGFRKIYGETMVYQKKPKNSYTTYTAVFVVIFLVSSLVRLIFEIRNYVLIRSAPK